VSDPVRPWSNIQCTSTSLEIEAADDFILTASTTITGATFTGLLFHGGHGEIRDVVVEIYRVFPNDSTDPPSGQVPTRMNSPSDNTFAEASRADGTLRFTASVINPHFEAANSVINGIHPRIKPRGARGRWRGRRFSSRWYSSRP
jgi:hypothetical protein